MTNFRGISSLELDLEDTTVLIGENNAGKTAVLDALRLCLRELGPRRRAVFDLFDFHLRDAGTDPSTADPIEIVLTFAEQAQNDWDDAKIRRLRSILHVRGDGTNAVVLRVSCAYNRDDREVEANWDFLDAAGQPLAGKTDSMLSALQREVSYFYLAALRDAARHFDAKGPFWRPFLKDSQLPSERKDAIEAKLREINDLVVTSHASFNQARTRLEGVQQVVPLGPGTAVSIEAIPGKIFDMLSRAQVHLGTPSGAKVPVGRHGEGTQSLAVLILFSAFLDLWPAGAPIVALEEPEAHLHPSAVRALWSTIAGISGQKLISSHSGDLLSETDIHSVRRLARSATGVKSYRVAPGLLSDEETRKFNYHVRRTRGELLFARAWLLVEGETEGWIYPAVARATRVDLHREGVRLVEYSQSDVGLLAKVANALGIPWYCVADNDPAWPQKYEAGVRANLNGRPEADCFVLPYVNAEVHLLSNGYDVVYAPLMPAQNLQRVTKTPGDADYWQEYAHHLPPKAKTRGAASVAVELERRGPAGVTTELSAVLTKIVALARGG